MAKKSNESVKQWRENNPEEYRAYQRELMRKRRAQAAEAAKSGVTVKPKPRGRPRKKPEPAPCNPPAVQIPPAKDVAAAVKVVRKAAGIDINSGARSVVHKVRAASSLPAPVHVPASVVLRMMKSRIPKE